MIAILIMGMSFNKAIIFTKKADSKAKSVANEVQDFLQKRSIEVLFEPQKADLAVVIGGDGSFLGAVRELNNAIKKDEELPLLLGIHTGSLGFLTECTLDGWKASLEKGLQNGFNIETRSMLDVRVEGNEAIYTVLNDLVINRNDVARMIEFDIYCNDEFVSSTKADGVVVSTPTGSTAYSLAAGGPIMHPSIPAFVITPICPHTLTNRPIVVSDSAQVQIKVKTDTDDILITLDGQKAICCGKGRLITASKSTRYLKLARPNDTTYFNILRNKLSFGRRG